MTITEFLLARIEADEARARYVSQYGASSPDPLFGPSRTLTECAAKRAIIEPFVELANSADLLVDAYKHAIYKTLLRGVIAPLAAVYADHPDYLEKWAL